MEITQQQSGAVLVVRPCGPLVGDASEKLRAHVRTVLPSTLGRLIVDLSEVPFLDSHGVESLLDSSDQLSAMGLPLRLCGVNNTVSEVLRITGHTDAFEFHPDSSTGVRSFL